MIVGAEGGFPADYVELRWRWPLTGRLSVDAVVMSSVDQYGEPLLSDAVLSMGFLNRERIYPRWSAAVHLALRVNTSTITAIIWILV